MCLTCLCRCLNLLSLLFVFCRPKPRNWRTPLCTWTWLPPNQRWRRRVHPQGRTRRVSAASASAKTRFRSQRSCAPLNSRRTVRLNAVLAYWASITNHSITQDSCGDFLLPLLRFRAIWVNFWPWVLEFITWPSVLRSWMQEAGPSLQSDHIPNAVKSTAVLTQSLFPFPHVFPYIPSSL